MALTGIRELHAPSPPSAAHALLILYNTPCSLGPRPKPTAGRITSAGVGLGLGPISRLHPAHAVLLTKAYNSTVCMTIIHEYGIPTRRHICLDPSWQKMLAEQPKKKYNLATTHPSVTGQTPKCAASGALDRRDWNHRRPTCFLPEHL